MSKPMFAKRHYEAIAQALQTATIKSGDVSGAEREIAEMFAADNPRFNRGRFEAACVPGANVRQRGRRLAKAVYAETLRESSRQADLIDGYNRDDLGESPDF